LKAALECSDAVIKAATQQALDFIQINYEEIVQLHGWPTHTGGTQ